MFLAGTGTAQGYELGLVLSTPNVCVTLPPARGMSAIPMLTIFLAALPFGANWYDVVIILGLAYGVYDGIRTGFSGEILRVVGWVSMIAVAALTYKDTAPWLMHHFDMEKTAAELSMFIGIAMLTWAAILVVRRIIHQRLKVRPLAGFVESGGGAVLGAVRLAVILAWVTIGLALIRSPFWHKQVARDSRFGSYLVQHLPVLTAHVEKNFPETMIFFREIKRREELDYEKSIGK
jgi:uncharacterized membrane protein required for colicin V production